MVGLLFPPEFGMEKVWMLHDLLQCKVKCFKVLLKAVGIMAVGRWPLSDGVRRENGSLAPQGERRSRFI